jgi:chaperonin GroEL (HSP60 family)
MNKCILQRWEFFDGKDYLPSGSTIHIDKNSHNKYLENIYNRKESESLDVVLGTYINCFVSDSIFDSLTQRKTIILSENELNNLISLEDIIIREVPSF